MEYPLTLTPYTDTVSGFTDQMVLPTEKEWSPVFVTGSNLLIPTLINQKGPVLMHTFGPSTSLPKATTWA